VGQEGGTGTIPQKASGNQKRRARGARAFQRRKRGLETFDTSSSRPLSRRLNSREWQGMRGINTLIRPDHRRTSFLSKVSRSSRGRKENAGPSLIQKEVSGSWTMTPGLRGPAARRSRAARGRGRCIRLVRKDRACPEAREAAIFLLKGDQFGRPN